MQQLMLVFCFHFLLHSPLPQHSSLRTERHLAMMSCHSESKIAIHHTETNKTVTTIALVC